MSTNPFKIPRLPGLPKTSTSLPSDRTIGKENLQSPEARKRTRFKKLANLLSGLKQPGADKPVSVVAPLGPKVPKF